MIREKISKVNLNAPSIILIATLWVVFILNITFAKNIFNEYSTNVIYISDHGESLGEGGLYLHGLPYSIAPESQTHVPAMVWSGDHSNIDRTLTRKNSENVYTHDNLALTLLNLFGISTTNIQELTQSFIAFR